ncbi:MAG: EAL domain-containing protein [Clostridia bacterium]|nr:EAL domain-containing protein [Clostridia bacterium]
MTHKIITELIASNAFELYGQPKWTFGKNTCNTYEVFAEQVHLSGEATIPAWILLELIARDEELTLIWSKWFLQAAIVSATELSTKTNSHVTLSVNLLPQYAGLDDFVPQVLEVLEKTGFSPKKLQFELSEVQHLNQRGIENLNRLHDEYGVGLYLSNFGKGHANIHLLADVHFDGIELDRAFAAQVPHDDQMVRLICAIQNMADTLSLKVCAKGIETPDQFDFFDQLKVFKGQGFLIGRPMPMDALLEYINAYAVHAD